jgi:hypothetical protein
MIANLAIAVQQLAGVVTRVFVSINGAPLAEVQAVADAAGNTVARLAATIGATVSGEIRRTNTLGHCVATPFSFLVVGPAAAHPAPDVAVQSYDDEPKPLVQA